MLAAWYAIRLMLGGHKNHSVCQCNWNRHNNNNNTQKNKRTQHKRLVNGAATNTPGVNSANASERAVCTIENKCDRKQNERDDTQNAVVVYSAGSWSHYWPDERNERNVNAHVMLLTYIAFAVCPSGSTGKRPLTAAIGAPIETEIQISKTIAVQFYFRFSHFI